MKSIFRTALTGALLAIVGATNLIALDTEYKSYKKASQTVDFFEIVYDKSFVDIYAIDGDDQSESVEFHRRDIRVKNDEVWIGDELLCDEKGLRIDGYLLAWEAIYDIQLSEKNKRTRMIFKKREGRSGTASSRRRGNIIEFSRDITIGEDEFVRGVVFSVLGDIRVEGEVSHDIVSLFGDIRISGDAVARGDVAALVGKVDISGSVSVYGEVFETKTKRRKRSGRRGRFYRNAHNSDPSFGFIYNRVDGAHPWMQYEFSDGDSLLPTVTVRGGYAFNSERWRYDIGLEQVLLRSMPLALGVGLHRKLATDDGHLLKVSENTVFALTVREDYMDYYEAEGGRAYLRAKPLKKLTIETGYNLDETGWLPARTRLWSLFGGSRSFSTNFSSVAESYRTASIIEIDSSTNATAYLKAEYDNRRRSLPFAYDAWVAKAEAEWSLPDLDSDYDYRRFKADLTRFQRLNRRAMLVFHLRYGTSKGYLPMYKRFYVGGLGTLRGYEHKELMGTDFWMGNFEYRFGLPGSDLGFGLIYDVAQIVNDGKLSSESEMLHSVGASVYIGDDFRVILAKRLDRSHDDSPEFYVRLSSML